jgi:hypothetical protein
VYLIAIIIILFVLFFYHALWRWNNIKLIHNSPLCEKTSTNNINNRILNQFKIVKCIKCQESLKLEFPILSNIGRCPSCGFRFIIVIWDSDHNLYITEMESSVEDSNNRSTEDKLSIYLRSLELDTNININDLSVTEIRKAYYKAVHNYHPDKYSGLPQEFQQLATRKTIQLNEAYHSLIRVKLGNGESARRLRQCGRAP